MRIQAALQEFSKKPWIEELEIDGRQVEVIQANKGIGNTPTDAEIKKTDRNLVLGDESIMTGENSLGEDAAKEALEKAQSLYQLFQKMFETTVAYEKSGGNPKDRETLLHEVDPRQQYVSKTEACITTVPHKILQQYIRKNFSQGQKKEEVDGIYRPNIAPIASIDDLDELLIERASEQLADSQLGALEIQFVYNRDEAQRIAQFAQKYKLIVLDVHKPTSNEWKPYDVGIGDLNGMKDITVTAHTAGSIRKVGKDLKNIPVQMLTGPAMLVGNIKGNLETHFGTPSGPQKELLLQLLADPEMVLLLNTVSGDYETASKREKLAMVANAILKNAKELLEKVTTEAEEKFRQLYYQDSENGDLLEAGEIISLPGAGRFALRSLAQYFHQLKNEEGEESKKVRYLTFKPAWPYAKVLGTDVANIDHIEATEDYLPDPKALDQRLQKAKDGEDEEAFDVVILNYPNNPSGVVPDRERLKEVYKVCIKHGVRVINDNSYMNVLSEGGVLENSALSSFELMDALIREAEEQGDSNIDQLKKWRDNQLYEANALTKTVNQPSARVGFVGTKDEQAQEHLRSFMTEDLDGEHNHMALAFFNNFADDPVAVREQHDRLVRETIAERINITTRVIDEEDGVECVVPEGAFYLNVDFRKYIDYDGNQKDLLNSTWFSGDRIGLLLSEYFGVTEFPNETMKGKNGILRFGLGGPMEDPEEFARITRVAIRRIKAYIDIARVKVSKLQKGTNLSQWDDEAVEMVQKYFSEGEIANDEYVEKEAQAA